MRVAAKKLKKEQTLIEEEMSGGRGRGRGRGRSLSFSLS